MKELHLLGKLVKLDECPIVLDYKPDENWQKYFDVKLGTWSFEDGYLVGREPGNRGGILFSKESYDHDVIFSFTMKTVLPATRDLNGVFCAHWDDEINYLGNAYVFGLNGWYEHKSGIERSPETGLRSLTGCYKYTPGEEVRITTGIIEGHSFLYVDGELVSELIDPHYISGGHVGFSPYCTVLAIKDIEVRRAVWEPFEQSYEPEF
ncbi:MAG: hypothetical protein IIW20_02680 [Clostridia bacterium]|jgi:hypothetical protein|nr:hypothetical protein [Clostridia bacterium]